MASASDPSSMTREELEERVAELEDAVEQLQPLAELVSTMGDTDASAATMHDVLVAGQPLGLKLQKLERQNSAMSEYLFGEDYGAAEMEAHVEEHGELETAAGRERGQAPEPARDEMLPAHRMAVDIRNGHEERIKADKSKRAAELFRRMMHKVADGGDPQPGVDNSGGTVTIKSSDAAEIILAFDDDLDSAPSATVTRAFRELQRLTKRDDCDCDSINDCPHGLVMFQAGATNRVAANTQRLIDYLEDLDTIEAGANGDVSNGENGASDAPDTDDAGNSVEATAGDTLDQLADAGREARNGTANDVVSSNERPTLGAENDHVSGDTRE